jgi:PAS domain S-box-containing protein
VITPAEAEATLVGLASVFAGPPSVLEDHTLEARYRTLVEQVQAVVFMAYLDRGIGEAYVSPRIEEVLGFTQAEWLEDPVRWYNQVHPDDRTRWSTEAAEMFLTGRPLRSAYRVIARDGHVVWFHCEAKMVRRDDGQPWFIHGVGFDITELKRTEAALQEERNVVSAILDTVGALVVVLDPKGRIIRSNRACEQLLGRSPDAMYGQSFWNLFAIHEGELASKEFESGIKDRAGEQRWIAWSCTTLPPAHVIATGIDITERRRMEEAILDVSTTVQRQIAQDLHDGLGQHLTGIAFMSKVLEQKLTDSPEAVAAAKIVRLVNEAINKTRELSRGLLPVLSDAEGLLSALKRWAGEVEDLFHVPCEIQCMEPIDVPDVRVATQVYHIVQEAVSNAIRHAKPTRVCVSLRRTNDDGNITIEDDGVGLPDTVPSRTGLGLHIMRYRANLVGGSLEVRRGRDGGTVVSCRFPLSP